MNKKILGASALLAAASAFAFATWHGDMLEFKVDTEEVANDSETAGYWFSYADGADGGKSEVIWPVPIGNEFDGGEEALDPVIEYCNGVCGTYSLNKGALKYDPFVGIGFNVVGEDAAKKPEAGDVTAWGGVCISYTVDIAATLEMGLTEAGDKSLAYDNPFVTLPKAATAVTKTFAWAKFAQAGWGLTQEPAGIEMSGPTAATQLASLKFKIQGKNVTTATGKFNIMSIGPLAGDCAPTAGPSGDVGAIGASVAQSAVKAQLSGRTLSFGKTVASAEIINLQGQVIMAASSVKTMDLSKVQAGVYMVRSAGLSQKIILK